MIFLLCNLIFGDKCRRIIYILDFKRGDVNGDKAKDILISIDSGGSGGFAFYS